MHHSSKPILGSLKGRIIDFLDIGHGKGERLTHYSKKKGRLLVGVDLKIEFEIPGVHLIEGDAVEVLKELPAECVKVLNSDFAINEIRPDARIVELFKYAHRIMVPNGRFFILTDKQNAGDFRKMLESNRFSVFQRELTGEELKNPSTYFTGVRNKEMKAIVRSWLDNRKLLHFTSAPIVLVSRKI